jgi:autotransporter-associated beta strand protein
LNVKNGGAIIDTNGNTVTISNSLVNFGGTSTGGLTKSGAGTLTLNAANTYAGATTISAGTLALGASGSIATSSGLNLGTSGSQGTLDITSQSSFTFGASQTVSGYGTVNIGTGKTVTINGNLAPGNSAGIMTVTGDLALANKVAIPTTGAITTMELGGNAGVAGTDYDQVVVSGQITFGGTLNIISLNSYNINQDATYHLFTGIRTGDFDFVTVAGTSLTDSSGVWTGTASSFDYTFTQSTGDLVISATVIPEPSTYAALVSLGILAFTVYRRRRSS